jgi:hypothetical protein
MWSGRSSSETQQQDRDANREIHESHENIFNHGWTRIHTDTGIDYHLAHNSYKFANHLQFSSVISLQDDLFKTAFV